jgi:hypothetical protein
MAWKASAARACKARCWPMRFSPRRAGGGRGRAVRARAQPLRLFVVAPRHARKRRPQSQLAGLHRPLPATPSTTASPTCCCRHLAAQRRQRSRLAAYAESSTASAPADGAERRPVRTPRRPVLSVATTPPGASRRCATCCRNTARAAAAGLDRPAHRPGPQRPRRTHLRLPDDAAALAARPRWWGPQVTSIYDGSSSSALLSGPDVDGRLRGVPAGRVHRHRAGIRHPAAAADGDEPARRAVDGKPP